MHPRSTLSRAGSCRASLALAATALAQSIPNPSFELNSFTVWPGYIPGNAPITDWNGSDGSGLNPAAGSPFADNGAVPNGSQVAFVQSGSIDTVITGLTPGTSYRVSFRVNARGGQAPILDLQIDGVSTVTSPVNSVGGTNPYRYVAVDFTATAATATLALFNIAAGDNTFVVDDFAIAPSNGSWKAEAWNDDATSGVDTTLPYTHAYNFGSAASTTINGVEFTGVAGLNPAVASPSPGVDGANPAVAGRFSTAGLTGIIDSDLNNVVEESRTLANTFVYTGDTTSGTLTLQGLIPGKQYELTIFSVNWDGSGTRWATFRSGSDQRSFDQDAFGDNNGIRFIYRYTADASGTVSVRTHPIQNASIHWYGFANREAIAVPAPGIVVNPIGTTGTIGQSVSFSAAASGTPAPTLQWLKGAAPIPGATSVTLTFTVAGIGDIGNYSLRATSPNGVATSTPAFLEVYEALAGVFGTGLDDNGVVLADGEVDPHYTLFENPDNPGVTEAFVQDSNTFPIVAPSTWIPVSTTSAWIGPRFNTAAAAGPNSLYTYHTSIDLTGKPLIFTLTGRYSVDNTGPAVRLNGVPLTGVPQSGGFGAYTPFTVTSDSLAPGTIINGINTLAFDVVNGAVGYTGLRVDGLQVIVVPAGVTPVIRTQPKGGGVTSGTPVTLTTTAYGSAPLAYQWFRGPTAIGGATASSYTIPSFSQTLNGDYTVRVSNTTGNATSDIATLTALNVPPSITVQPQPRDGGMGESVIFSVTADGSAPLTYQWIFGTTDIPNSNSPTLTVGPVTLASAGNYSVRITNGFGAPAVSDSVALTIGLRGIYDTGVDNLRATLADGADDPHYKLIINPNGQNDIPAVVHTSTIWPIVAGPWFLTSALSKWIAPVADTGDAVGEDGDAGEGGGVYVYRLVVDATGFDPSTVSITGGWASDNMGTNIRVNGQDTGVTNTVQFPSLTPFTIDSSNATFVAGTNTIDFLVQNQTTTHGPTGLRVEGLRGLGTLLPPGPDLPTVSITINASNQPVISFTGVAGTQYRFQRSTTLVDGSWFTQQTVTPVANGLIQYTDTNPPVGLAYYRVAVGP